MARPLPLAALFLSGSLACVSGTDGSDVTWEGCTSDVDCKEGRVCRDGACVDEEPTGSDSPDGDIGRVLFRLALSGGAAGPVFVQEASEEREDAWLTLLKGPTGDYSQPIAPTCMVCFCGNCASCGGLCGPGRPSVRRLDPGEVLDLRWDGTTFPVDSTCPNSGPCFSIRPATTGGTYRAKFCWSLAATGEGLDQQLLPPQYCQERAFEYDADRAQLVSYTITG